jgi:PAS domain S-box-containing protein
MLGFGLVLAVLLANAAFSYANVRRLIENDRRVGQTRDFIAKLEEVLALMVDAETGQRGYLLTGQTAFLEPYHKAAGVVEDKVKSLGRRTAKNTSQWENLRTLDAQIVRHLADLAGSEKRRGQPGWSMDETEVGRLDQSRRAMDEIRETVARLRAEEQDQLRQGSDESADSARATVLTLAVACALSVALVLASYVWMSRERKRRRRSAEAVLAEREWLHVTLLSIREAVIATDADGRVRLLNPVAQTLTGWSQEDAVGRPVSDCFRLVNEETRRPVDDPVRRVLREGTVQGLANHSLLLARDGGEHPIDNSGGPIRDARGEIIGAVLVFRDVTERRRAEEALLEAGHELQRRAEELAAADRRKDNFLALLGHELRNPLAPIRNAVTLLDVSRGDPAAVAQARAIVDRQVRHLTRLVDDLLDASRIANNKIQLRREHIDLGQVVRATVEDQRPTLEEAGLALTVDVPASPLWVEGDAVRLAQVVGNLLQNGQKFTDAGGRVEVAARGGKGRATVSVRDTGTGIEPEMLPRLFEAFSQADRSLDRSRGGLGLGLALVRGLVRLHGGGIEAASEGPGRGATFTFWVPLTGDAVAPPAAPAPAAAEDAKLRVLVIEDHRDAADSLRQVLELTGGHTVAVAYTGTEGVELASHFRPDVVLCDLGLPGLTGFEVARALRRGQGTATSRLIAISGYGREEDQRRAREAGFDDALVKPVDLAELQRILARPSASLDEPRT